MMGHENGALLPVRIGRTVMLLLKVNKERIYRVLSVLGPTGTFLGLYLSLRAESRQLGFLEGFGLAIALVVVLAAILFAWSTGHKRRLIPFDEKHKINDYMYQWIDTGGQVAIFTRDHTWVDDDRMRALLEKKAKRGELTICLPRHTSLTEQLKQMNAKIYEYGSIDHIPQTRFTVTHFGQAGAQVAVGRPQGQFHVIEEFAANDPAFHVAVDLVEITSKFSAPKP